jgi:sensor histidine kinase YesM
MLFGSHYGITISSEPDKGTTVFLRITTALQRRHYMIQQVYKVLIADDEYWTRENYAR